MSLLLIRMPQSCGCTNAKNPLRWSVWMKRLSRPPTNSSSSSSSTGACPKQVVGHCFRSTTSTMYATLPPASTLALPLPSTTRGLQQLLGGAVFDLLNQAAVWLIKRTFQPSIIRKKRKMGFLVRQRTVGGRRTLKRRRAKGRARLGGGI